jgi:type II secretory pathway component GspD/PulD (secretin)
MTTHVPALILLAGLFALPGGAYAQNEQAPKHTRTVYVAKYGDVKQMASVLGKHFKGDAEIQVLPDSPSNCLLISAPPKVFAEIANLLELLDRRPRLISVELYLAEVTPQKGDDGKRAGLELDAKEFTGPGKEVVAKAEALIKQGGLIGTLRRIQLTTVENQPATVSIGENKAHVGRAAVRGQKFLERSNTGTTARVMVRVTPEDTLVLDLSLDDSRRHDPESGVEVDKDETGTPIRAPEFIQSMVKTTLTIPSGQATAVGGIKTEAKTAKVQFLLIVTAQLVDSASRGRK